MDKGQLGAFSQGELELLKNFVKSREDSVLLLRNHFLQLDLTPEETIFLRSLSPDTLAVLKKNILPDLTRDVPLTLEATLYQRLEFIGQYSTEGAFLHIEVNDIIVTYLKEQFEALTGDADITIILKDLPKELGTDQQEMRVKNMLAYNKIIQLVLERMQKISLLGDPPQEEMTDKEKKEMIQKNSAK